MALGLWGLVNAAPAVACTKLTYLDASGNAYHGRTMDGARGRFAPAADLLSGGVNLGIG